jgi:hypothetical protein
VELKENNKITIMIMIKNNNDSHDNVMKNNITRVRKTARRKYIQKKETSHQSKNNQLEKFNQYCDSNS